MELLKQSLDMADELAQLEDHLDMLETENDRLVAEATEIEDSEDGDPERFKAIKQRTSQLDNLISVTEGYIEVLNRAIDDWGGSEIVFRELTGAETRATKARAQRKADEQGMSEYVDEFHETLFLEKAVDSTPPGCPDPDSIGDLPDRMFDWFLGRANALNSVGDFDMGNSSLREKMADHRANSSN